MTKEQKEIIVIAVGVLILALAVSNNLKKKKPKPAAPAPPASSGAVSAANVISEKKDLPADEGILSEQKKRAELPWSRDPFVGDIVKEEKTLELKLQGISFGQDNVGFAYINNQIVKKGDKIEQYEIAEVLKDKVLLKRGAQSFYLTFSEE